MPEDKDRKEYTRVDMSAEGTKKVRMDFPPNTHRSREEKEEPKKIEKVIKGGVRTKKKSFGRKVLETFIGDDIYSVSSYVFYDVLIPAAKDTLANMVKGGIEMLLFGESKGSRTSRDKGRSYVSYDRYNAPLRRDERREMSPRNRARHNFDDIVLDSRGEAEEVLSNMVDLIIDYGQATVADLYSLVGISDDFTDRKWGWVDLRSASVTAARGGGWQMNLPRAILLD